MEPLPLRGSFESLAFRQPRALLRAGHLARSHGSRVAIISCLAHMMDGGRPERHCPHRPSRGKKRRSSDSFFPPSPWALRLSTRRASERATSSHTRLFWPNVVDRGKTSHGERLRAAAASPQSPIRMATTGGGEPSVERGSGIGANAGEEKSSVNPTAASLVGRLLLGGGKRPSFRNRCPPLQRSLSMSPSILGTQTEGD